MNKQEGYFLEDEEITGSAALDNEAVKPSDEISSARETIEGAIEQVKNGDIKAAYCRETLTALAAMKANSLGDYISLRNDFKRACPAISLTELDKAIKPFAKRHVPQTQHSFAKEALAHMTVLGWSPVYFEGELYVVDSYSKLWVPMEKSAIYDVIVRQNDGHRLCSKEDDYRAITECVYIIAEKKGFFTQAATGIASSQDFYRVTGTEISVEELTPAHFQRVQIEFPLEKQATPLFDNFLEETFKIADAEEAEQQKRLVQEIAGAAMLGMMHKHQKAVLFYDPYGRAGKGTLESILRQLVPANFVKAVSPFKWNNEYYLMALAGARLNVVGELPDDQAIPAASFKSVIGKDPQTGRNPSGRPVVFTCEAAHVFMSNHLITTRDHSEAFFGRWLIVEFPNSRLKSGLPIDPDIASRIAEKELSGIAHWALEGGRRLLSQGKFSQSKAHDRLMEKWRNSSSSVEEFIHECCTLGEKLKYKRKDFYRQYQGWCKGSGRSPFASIKLKEMLVHNIALGVRCVEINGYETFKGVTLKEEFVSSSDREFDL